VTKELELWIVRNGEDPWKAAPEVADAISKHPGGKPNCLFCGDDHEDAAIMAWRDGDFIKTASVCRVCAVLGDEPRKFDGWAASHFSPRH
jgi:hypothetical protein